MLRFVFAVQFFTRIIIKMGGACSRRVQPAEAVGEMTVPEAFALLDGAAAKGARGSFLFHVGAGADASSFLLQIDEESAVARVLDARRLQATEIPPLTCTITYKSAALFFAEARGKLPVSAYVVGQVRVKGDMKAAEALEPVWEPLVRALRERDAALGATHDDDLPFDSDAFGLAASGPPVPWYAIHLRAWWVRHFGTDNMQGTWLTLIGTLLWLVENVVLGTHGGGGLAWAQVASAFFFLVSFGALLEISYPEQLAAMLADASRRAREEELAAKRAGAAPPPPPLERAWGWFERLGLSNALGRGIAWMLLGMVPFLVLAAASFARAGVGSVLGWAMLVFLGLFAPPLVLLARSASEASIRDMARGGQGSRTFYQWVQQRFGRKGGPLAEALERHLGTDSKAGLWAFFALMLFFQLLVTPTLFLMPRRWQTHVEFWEVTCFTVGLGLQLRANYPEYANESLLLGRLAD